jgi:hypothetical protein
LWFRLGSLDEPPQAARSSALRQSPPASSVGCARPNRRSGGLEYELDYLAHPRVFIEPIVE